jgi:hypothetical protein
MWLSTFLRAYLIRVESKGFPTVCGTSRNERSFLWKHVTRARPVFIDETATSTKIVRRVVCTSRTDIERP